MTKSRWANWSRGTEYKVGFGSFMKEAIDSGNPSGTGTVSPAERARQLGLQSDGSGGYTDESGNIVARTVNNELVFYDHRGATGGVVSDGEGGQQLANAQPSWSDPKTGMLTTPPAQPESPEEMSAVPDATPSVAPSGYSEFMKKKKQLAYAEPEEQDQPAEMGGGVPPMDGMMGGMMGDGDMGLGDAGGMMGEDYEPENLQKKVTPEIKKPISAMQALINKRPEPQTLASQMAKPEVQQPEPEVQNEPKVMTPERQQQLKTTLDRMNAPSSLTKGAGANQLSLDDINLFRNYIKNGSQNKSEEVSSEDLDFAMDYLKTGAGKKWSGLQNRLKGKGDPEPSRKVVSRAREIVESYLRNQGHSDIDGSELPFSDSELDHGISLSNGGEDIGDNWRWLPKRFNQFKGDLDDDSLMEALEKEETRQNDPDFQIKQQENEFTNTSREDWKSRFGGNGWEELNVADIREAKGTQGLQMLKALAEKAGVSYYKNRDGARASGRAGGGTQLGVEELQDRLIDELGIPDNVDVSNFDKAFFDLLQRNEDKRSDLASSKIARRKEKRELKKKE
tara:strand:+ start:4093 stop:5784 length:1692 start_codon:yes stop_codon:yes gene_type:complete